MIDAGGSTTTSVYEVQSSGNPGGALGVILLRGDVEPPLCALGMTRPLPLGGVRVAHLEGVDQAVVARIAADAALVIPHANTGAIRALCESLERAGCARLASDPDPRARYPEAEDQVEACMLDALAHAPSLLAVDLLLDQPRRWRAREPHAHGAAEIAQHSVSLNRLLRPPIVAAVGEANIGKSALLNALARRAVSIVADEPGVTRDHVGARLDLDGLCVWWVDTPGRRDPADAAEAAALSAAASVVASADLVVSCADHASEFVDASFPRPLDALPPIRVGLRSDLGPTPGAALTTSAHSGDGLARLSEVIREALVPARSLHWPGPWRFHHALPG